MRFRLALWLLPALALAAPSASHAACCYFSAKNADILQPAQKVFITWDPESKTETFTVQPKFEGNAQDFGMVIPTPTQPKLHEMPRDFFRHLAVYSILKQREFPRSKLLPTPPRGPLFGGGAKGKKADGMGGADPELPKPKPTVIVVEAGLVGSLDYKIIKADRADDLYQWLKDNKYTYAGDEATLDFYVKKNYFFTVMKIDTMQMKKNKDGSYAGDVTPTRFTFTSEKLMYPLKITQISVKDKTEALFYVQAPFKADLDGDNTYQYTWVPMLQSSRGKSFGKGKTTKSLPGGGDAWLTAIQEQIPGLLTRSRELDYRFIRGKRPEPNQRGRTPTTMEWARKLTADDLKILTGGAAYGETVPNVDEGFTQKDVSDPIKGAMVVKTINERLAKARADRPFGYLVRYVPADDVRALQQLAGHLREGLFITKFRKIFTRDEMNDDLTIVPARVGQQQDNSEYEEILPSSPP